MQVHEEDSKQDGWWKMLAVRRKGDWGHTDCRGGGTQEMIPFKAEEGKSRLGSRKSGSFHYGSCRGRERKGGE